MAIAATAALGSAPMQSFVFLTGLPRSSARRGTTGVRRNLSSGPDLGRPRCEVTTTWGGGWGGGGFGVGGVGVKRGFKGASFGGLERAFEALVLGFRMRVQGR